MTPRRIWGAAVLVALASPAALWASQESAGDGTALMVRLFAILGVMLVAGKLSGELFERLGQPAVLGELLAGIVLGGSVLGVIPTGPGQPLSEVISIFAEIGVVVLLFEIGLETDLKQMFRVGAGAFSVATVGVVLPLAAGILFWLAPFIPATLNYASPTTTAIFLGATLTATSVGITARVLQDLRLMHSIEARIVIGAAVIDDIMGIVLLGLVSALVAGQAVSVWSLGRSVAVAVGFLVAAVGVGLAVAPKVFGVLEQLRVRGMLLVAGFAFLLFMSAAADRVGLAMIIGAFAAGLVLSGTNQFDVISEQIKPVADVFTPVFFLSIGAKFDVRLLDPSNPRNVPVLLVGGALFAIAVAGKLAAGWAAPWMRFNRPGVGIGMIPRGEVGLIFANMGLVAGVVSTELFSAVIIMLMGTTFIAPPLLKWSFARWGVTDATGVHAVPAEAEALRADPAAGGEE